MAANSKHYGDVYLWILKVIESCNTYKETMYIPRLIQSYLRYYPDRKLEQTLLYDSLSRKRKNILTP
jgi:hypothetical protein